MIIDDFPFQKLNKVRLNRTLKKPLKNSQTLSTKAKMSSSSSLYLQNEGSQQEEIIERMKEILKKHNEKKRRVSSVSVAFVIASTRKPQKKIQKNQKKPQMSQINKIKEQFKKEIKNRFRV